MSNIDVKAAGTGQDKRLQFPQRCQHHTWLQLRQSPRSLRASQSITWINNLVCFSFQRWLVLIIKNRVCSVICAKTYLNKAKTYLSNSRDPKEGMFTEINSNKYGKLMKTKMRFDFPSSHKISTGVMIVNANKRKRSHGPQERHNRKKYQSAPDFWLREEGDNSLTNDFIPPTVEQIGGLLPSK